MKQEARNEIIEDILYANNKYQNEFSTENFINRNHYRKFGNFSQESIMNQFGNWTNASDEAKKLFISKLIEPVDDNERLDYEKQILSLKNNIKELKKEKNILLLNKLNEEKIISKFEKKIIPLKIPKDIKSKKIKENKEIESILMLSDLHASEVLYLDELEGINEYNIDIMIQRLDKIFEDYIYYNKKNNITKTNIFFLGDLFSGDIHDELTRTNEFNIVDTQFILLDYFFKKLCEIEKHFSSIKINILAGNHSRIKNGKPEYKTAGILNWEYIFAENLKRSVIFSKLDKKINIIVNKSLFNIVNVTGRKFLLLHGHVLCGGSGGFAGIPFYGLAMSSAKFYGILEQNKIELSNEKPFQDILMGHLHSTTKFGIFNGGMLYINGCVVGISEYSLFKVKGISKIEQTMLFVSEGKIISEYTLNGK